MKILRIIVGSIAALAIILGGVGLMLPAKVHLERTILIDATAARVFLLINNFQGFNEWSPWAALDPATQYEYSGPASGVGATMTWASDNPNVGKGSQTILASETDRHVRVSLQFGDMDSAIATYDLAAEGSGTRVTWGFDQEFGYNIILRYFGLMFDRWIGADYEKGLARLKSLAQSTDAAVPTNLPPSTPAVVDAVAPAATPPPAATGNIAALNLAKASGCLACHSIDKKVVGPAWRDVAVRYKGQSGARAQLIAKVKSGGKGNWTAVTNGAAMPPYSPRVSDDDIATLVDFVLAL